MIDVQRIIRELEEQREAIDSAISSLRKVSPTAGASAAATTSAKRGRPPRKVSGGRRHITPEGRKRIAEAQRRRWAAQKGEEAAPARKSAGRKRGRKAAGKRAGRKGAAASTESATA